MSITQGIHSGVEGGRENLILASQLGKYQKDTFIINFIFPTSLQKCTQRFELHQEVLNSRKDA